MSSSSTPGITLVKLAPSTINRMQTKSRNIPSSPSSSISSKAILSSLLKSSLRVTQLFKKPKNMDSSQKASYNAGEAKGQAQEKASNMMDKASNAAQSAKESMTEAGQQMKAKAQGAADAVKDALGQK